MSSTAGLRLPYITDDGQIIEFETQLRADAYSVSDVLLSSGQTFDGTTGRLVPQASVTWRYPFINRSQSGSVMLEPIVNFTASPGGGNPEKIPNEDSLVPEFTDTNLFSENRFAGYDRIEDGPRMSYGMRGQVQFLEDKYLDWLVGQHYRIDNDRNFPFSNELASHFSDYVGKVGLTYHPFGIAYRFRLDKDELDPKRSEVDAYFNYYPVSAYASYLSLKNDPILSTKEEIYGGTNINLSKKWILALQGRHDLQLDQITSTSAGLTYQNECTNIVTTVGRDYIQDRDVKSSTTFLVRIMLKNLN
jgi:LPS-assembly protein